MPGKQAKRDVQTRNEQLEERVAQRTRELAERNEELRRGNEILQKIFDHLPVMLCFIGAEPRRIEMMNRDLERTIGWTRAEVDAQNIDILAECYPDPQYHQRVLQFLAESNGIWADFKTKVRSGEVIDTTWAVVNLSDGTSICIGQDITDRKRADAERARLFEQARANREQLQVLSRQLLQAEEDERRAIARELHDEIGQLLTSANLLLTAAQHVRDDTARESRLAEARALVADLIERVRNLALDLRPALLDLSGLVAALRSLFQRYAAQTGVTVHFQPPAMEERFSPEVETAAYRIVQESLTNVARHAGVATAAVCLAADPETLSVAVEDTGRGFDPETVRVDGSTGLRGMRERTVLLGGRLTIDSAVGVGTRVTAVLPLRGAISP